MVHEVRPPDAEVENVDLLQVGVVKGIKEPGSVRHLVDQDTPVIHHMVVQSTSSHGRQTEGAIRTINTHAESNITHFRNTQTGGGNDETGHAMSNDTGNDTLKFHHLQPLHKTH